jgi:hypothetical protein
MSSGLETVLYHLWTWLTDFGKSAVGFALVEGTMNPVLRSQRGKLPSFAGLVAQRENHLRELEGFDQTARVVGSETWMVLGVLRTSKELWWMKPLQRLQVFRIIMAVTDWQKELP